jgi:hypothetical protein
MALTRLHALSVAYSTAAVLGLALAFGPVHAAPPSSDSETFAQQDDDDDIEPIDDNAPGAAEMKRILAEEVIPIFVKVVIADFKWRTDATAACEDVKTAGLAITAAETDVGTLKKALISETGKADVVQGFDGEMGNLKRLVRKLDARVCGSAPRLSASDKAVFAKATDMAETYFARLSQAMHAIAGDDKSVACQNLELAKTSAMDLKGFLTTESQASQVIYRETHSDDGVALLTNAEEFLDLSLDGCPG